MPNKSDKIFNNLIKKLKETSVKPKVLHETENERVEEYTLPIDFIDDLSAEEREGLYCWLNKDKIAQAWCGFWTDTQEEKTQIKIRLS